MMRLLIIEDSVALATNLKEIFDLEGYSTSVALNGHSGLELARKGFDVALVDIRLPDMLGTSLVPQLRALSTDAEVIIATANADLESAMAAVAAGAFAYLTKPVRSEELLLTVARAQNNIKLKRALATSERRLRTLVENVQALIVIANRQGILRFVSEASIDVIGADPSSLIGRNLVEWAVSHEEQDEWRAVLLETTQSAVVHEVSCLHADGSHRHLSWRWTRGTGDESDVLYGVGTDVTYRRELERRALMAEKLALAGQLTAGLAHEIRNPLNAAGLQLQVVSRLTEQGAAADDLRAPLEVVRHELQRLEELLHDFLDFARPRHYDRLPVDARVIVQRIIDLQEASAAAAGLSLTATFNGELCILGDVDALEQVLVNLVNNAIVAAREKIVIRTSTRDGRAIICVKDDGRLIPKNILERVFTPFFTTKPTGTGLGMAIAHAIISAHDGDISISSAESEGTVVECQFPLVDSPEKIHP